MLNMMLHTFYCVIHPFFFLQTELVQTCRLQQLRLFICVGRKANPGQIPPGAYICMTHHAACVLHTSEPTQNTFFNSVARSMQNVLTVAICQRKTVNGVQQDATSVNGRETFFFCNRGAKEPSHFKITF